MLISHLSDIGKYLNKVWNHFLNLSKQTHGY
jgi:hypothetical protein